MERSDYTVEADGHASCDSFLFFHKDNSGSLEDFAVLRNPDTGETLLEVHTDEHTAGEIVRAILPTSVLGGPDADNYFALTLSEADYAWLQSVVVGD